MTIIEILIYATLLSFLMAGFIQYAYAIHWSDLHVTDEINQ